MTYVSKIFKKNKQKLLQYIYNYIYCNIKSMYSNPNHPAKKFKINTDYHNYESNDNNNNNESINSKKLREENIALKQELYELEKIIAAFKAGKRKKGSSINEKI